MDFSTVTTAEWITIGLLALQTIGAIVAAIFAWRAYRQTQSISNQQHKQTEKIHKEQTTLAEKQAFVAVFEHLKDIQYIDVEAPNWIHAAKSANLLELIAVAWWKKIVDREMLFDLYGTLLVTVFEQIRDARDINTGEPKGRKMLKDNPAAIGLYKIWKKRVDQENLSRLGKNTEQGEQNVTDTQTTHGQSGISIG